MNRSFLDKLFRDDSWSLRYHKWDGNEIPDIESDWHVLESPKDRYWADPFVVSDQKCHFFFVEEYLYYTLKGHISVVVVKDNKIQTVQRILEKPHHLSYPQIFRHDDAYFMMPESMQANVIELYRCVNFPFTWELETVLMKNVSSTDSTIHFHKGLWWLFTYEINSAGKNLNLYYANSLVTDSWIAHPLNPIDTDVATARPAGAIFEMKNQLFRPSQDCNPRYGYATNIQKIQQWDIENYSESTFQKIEPVWNDSIATHTFNQSDQIVVIDSAKYKYRSLVNIAKKTKEKLTRN